MRPRVDLVEGERVVLALWDRRTGRPLRGFVQYAARDRVVVQLDNGTKIGMARDQVRRDI